MVVKESLKLNVIFSYLAVSRESETTGPSREASVALARHKPFSKLVFDV